MFKTAPKAYGSNHPAVTQSLIGLAFTYRSASEHSLAAPLFRQALKISDEILPPNHPQIVMLLQNLEAIELSMGNEASAMELRERLTKIESGEFDRLRQN